MRAAPLSTKPLTARLTAPFSVGPRFVVSMASSLLVALLFVGCSEEPGLEATPFGCAHDQDCLQTEICRLGECRAVAVVDPAEQEVDGETNGIETGPESVGLAIDDDSNPADVGDDGGLLEEKDDLETGDGDGDGGGDGDGDGDILCSEECQWSDDGQCDDGGPDSAYSVCPFGTDCIDCGMRVTSALPPEPVSCTDTCGYADDGECDDGGPNSLNGACTLGTDCTDCGAR